MTATITTREQRHPEADTTLVAVEASDAIDAVAGLYAMAREYRAKSRAALRDHEREAAWLAGVGDVYAAAAGRIQAVCDRRHTQPARPEATRAQEDAAEQLSYRWPRVEVFPPSVDTAPIIVRCYSGADLAATYAIDATGMVVASS